MFRNNETKKSKTQMCKTKTKRNITSKTSKKYDVEINLLITSQGSTKKENERSRLALKVTCLKYSACHSAVSFINKEKQIIYKGRTIIQEMTKL